MIVKGLAGTTNGLQAKRTDVPAAWADSPIQWWLHVASCPDCSQFFTPPDNDGDRDA